MVAHMLSPAPGLETLGVSKTKSKISSSKHFGTSHDSSNKVGEKRKQKSSAGVSPTHPLMGIR